MRLASPVVTPPARSNSKAAEPRTPTDPTLASPRRTPIDQPILESLVIPLAMVVIDKLLEGPSEMVLAQDGTIRLRHSCLIDARVE
jgi:hypothetical protein